MITFIVIFNVSTLVHIKNEILNKMLLFYILPFKSQW